MTQRAVEAYTPPLFPEVDLPDENNFPDGGEHGEVFTRPWVVEMILDLAGYRVERDLAGLRLVEPACGSGAFLEVVVRRLVRSAIGHGYDLADPSSLEHAVAAFDLLGVHVEAARVRVVTVLREAGMTLESAETLVATWVRQGDYLLADFEPASVDVVVGNPPYVRLEEVPTGLAALYRRRWPTMGGRADLFIGFIERGLRSLKPGGVLGFICADRWMRNQYGRGLRELIAARFSMDVMVSMHDVDAFEDAVSAYPAITILRSGRQGLALVADTTAAFGPHHAAEVIEHAGRRGCTDPAILPEVQPYTLAQLPHWFSGSDSWPQGSPDRLAMIEHLTDHFPSLEDAATGTKVGIGVASGADKVFIVDRMIDVEEDRLLPLATVRDLPSGHLRWSGRYLVNPWTEAGLVSLEDYPRLAAYFEANSSALRKRYVARDGRGWYRTIDRVDVLLTARSKLLIPDMRTSIHPVLDEGGTYPHHNLYHVTSTGWDLRVLGGLMLSEVANAFVEAYAVKMRGGTLRFQAQYLRRIRVPRRAEISASDAEVLALAFERRDVSAATTVALRLYGLDHLPE